MTRIFRRYRASAGDVCRPFEPAFTYGDCRRKSGPTVRQICVICGLPLGGFLLPSPIRFHAEVAGVRENEFAQFDLQALHWKSGHQGVPDVRHQLFNQVRPACGNDHLDSGSNGGVIDGFFELIIQRCKRGLNLEA
jgi:hypothetical protein